MGHRIGNAAGFSTGRVPTRSIPQMKRFHLAAVPAIGFVHGAVERRPRNLHLVERQDLRRRADNQRGRLSDLLDYGAAAFVVMAVAFGPLLAWLMLG